MSEKEKDQKKAEEHKDAKKKEKKEEVVTLKKEEHEALLKRVEELEGLKDQLLRSAADYENAKKRIAREKSEFLKFANENLISELLPVLDNLNRAIEQAEKANPDDPILKGIHLIEKHVFDILKKNGVSRIEAVGKPFDVELHEALGQVETTEVEEGTVVEELETGYQLHDKLIRPTRVRIAKAPEGCESENSENTEEAKEEE